MSLGEIALDKIKDFRLRIRDGMYRGVSVIGDWINLHFMTPTLEQTLIEKNGQGPHGYGDPKDPSIREEEHYLFPLMVWKKIRYEKCLDVTQKYYACVSRVDSGEDVDCKKEEEAMFACKNHYYSPEGIDSVERECIVEYVQLRSKFRETGSQDDLWQLERLMLEPGYDKLYEAIKRGATRDELIKLTPPKLKSPLY